MFKRYFTAVENTLLRIPFTAVFFAFLIPLYFMYSIGIARPISEKFFENLFCDYYLLHLYTPISLLILLSGIGVPKEDDATRYIRLKSRTELTVVNILSAVIASLFYIVIILLCFSVFFKFAKGMSLADVWSASVQKAEYESVLGAYPTPVVRDLFSPAGAVMMKCLFTWIYCLFLAIVSMTINVVFKQSVGSIACAMVILCTALFGKVDPTYYSLYPWFNGEFKTLTAINSYTHVYYAIIYWIVALTAVITLYYFVMKKSDLISLSREDRT